jgi:hypothetical protein
MCMKEIVRIDPVSTAKVAALLGILWAILGWLFSGIVISLLLQGDPAAFGEVPPQGFSIGGLLAGVVGGFFGGGVSGYFGSLFYNWLARKIGGVMIGIRDLS